MQTVTTEQFKDALLFVSDRIIASEDYLTELDTIIGDADHGFGMRVGFASMKRELTGKTFTDAGILAREASLALIMEMGGASGVIYGTMFLGGQKELAGKETISVSDFAVYFARGAEDIARRGKVSRGDKTMYDALIEAVESLAASAEDGKSVEAAFRSAHAAAVDGMEKTKDMLAKKGRAKNFREKVLGHPDTGAVSTCIIFDAFAEYFEAIA